MSHELKEGIKLEAVFWAEGGVVEVGKHGCTEIVVREQVGQMAMVPWAAATINDKVTLYNLALAEGVTVQ